MRFETVILMAVILTFMTGLASGYTADSQTTINSTLKAYTADSFSNINSTFGSDETFGGGAPPTDSCSCPGLGANWAIACSDNCVINTPCNISTGNITFTGTGTITFNASITANDIGKNPATCKGYWGRIAGKIKEG